VKREQLRVGEKVDTPRGEGKIISMRQERRFPSIVITWVWVALDDGNTIKFDGRHVYARPPS